MDADAFRTAAHEAIEEIIKYNQDIASNKLPVLPSIKPGYLRPMLPTSAPVDPQPWEEIQPDISSKIIPGLTHWQSPNFMAFFPACATYPSILGEMYSSAFTAPAFNWLCSPACTELETVVLDWLADALHLPADFRSDSPNGGGGVIQGSASEAIVTVMVAARERYLNRAADRQGLREGDVDREKWIMEKRSKLVALSSDQAHSSTAKGARIAGTWYRTVETKWEDELAVQPETLQRTIETCIQEGLEPYYITLSYGTTSTCAQDPLHLLAPVLEKYPDIWIHIDAAYAGTALICPEYANVKATPEDYASALNGAAVNGTIVNGATKSVAAPATANGTTTNGTLGPEHNSLPAQTQATDTDNEPLDRPAGLLPTGPQILSRVDSFNTNMHKWLLTSFDASLLYVRQRTSLTSALSITPAYLQNKHTDSGLVTDYRDWQIPLGRRFRALKIWFVLRSYGIQGLRAHIRRTARLGESFERLVRETDDGRDLFEVLGQATFGLTCLRVRDDVVAKALRAQDTNSSTSISTNEPSSPHPDAHTLANTLTKSVVEAINDSGTLFLTSSHTHTRTFVRVVSGNENGRPEHVRAAFGRLVDETRRALADLPARVRRV